MRSGVEPNRKVLSWTYPEGIKFVGPNAVSGFCFSPLFHRFHVLEIITRYLEVLWKRRTKYIRQEFLIDHDLSKWRIARPPFSRHPLGNQAQKTRFLSRIGQAQII